MKQSSTPVSDDSVMRDTFQQFLSIIQRCHLNDEATAAFVGCAPMTITLARLRGRMPPTRRVREAVERFVELNVAATSRQQIRAS